MPVFHSEFIFVMSNYFFHVFFAVSLSTSVMYREQIKWCHQARETVNANWKW